MRSRTISRRYRVALSLGLAAFLLILTADAAALAGSWSQGGGGFFGQIFGSPWGGGDPYYNRRGRGSGNPYLSSPDQGGFFSLFGGPKRSPPPRKVQPAGPPPVAAVEVKPKDAKARRVLVVGDFLAAGLAWGLDQEFADEPKLVVVDKSKDMSGLVRDDFFDWNKSLPDILNSEKPDLIVVLLGGNDRQPMRIGNQRIAVGSDSWEKTYAQRVEGVVDTLKVYGRPFFWMSVPPMRVASTAGDPTYLNGIYKTRVEAGGGTFVDVWNGFTNADGQYIGWGPDKDGQVRQLRTADGINFTGAGRLKLAFYAEREVRRKTGVGAGAADLLPSANEQTHIEIGPDGKKRMVGPVISLSDPLPGGSDTLAGAPKPAAAAPAPETPQSAMIDKGSALPSIAGRADDYAWPPPGPAAPVADAGSAAPVNPPAAAPLAAGKATLVTPVSKSN
jgi:hypothetical protein